MKLKRKAVAVILTFAFILAAVVVAIVFCKFNITTDISGNGVVVLEKNYVHLFSSATVYFASTNDNPDCKIILFTVNGEDKTNEIHKNRYKLRFVRQDIDLTVVFGENESLASAASSAVFV